MMQASKPPPPHVSPPGMWGSKLALRILQFILALSIIGCAGSTISTAGYLPYVENGRSLLLVAPQAIVSAIWSLSDGICILARGGRRGIHPGANVALDLLLWMGCMVGAVIVSVFGIPATEHYLAVTDERINRYKINYERQRANATAAVAMGQAMVGLGATLAILHFTTFVISCVETHQRNRNSLSPAVVYVAATQYQQYPQYYPQQPQYGQSPGVMYQPAPPQQVNQPQPVYQPQPAAPELKV